MAIEVKHDTLNLPAHVRIRVKNARETEKYINRYFTENFERGFRLRFIPDIPTNTMELSARQWYNVNMVLNQLKRTGRYVETLPWKINALLKKRAKTWEVRGESN